VVNGELSLRRLVAKNREEEEEEEDLKHYKKNLKNSLSLTLADRRHGRQSG
jgi:hypothetical protein